MSDKTQITVVICVAVLAFFWMTYEYQERIERERELTHRILATNGMEIKRFR